MTTSPKPPKPPTREAHIRLPLDVAERIQARHPGIAFAHACISALTELADMARKRDQEVRS